MKGSATVCSSALPTVRFRFADYAELARPRVAGLILFTVAAGFLLASSGTPDIGRLLHTLFGVGLVVAGASALNQVFERRSDSLMKRTRNRPLPTGRLRPAIVLLFGLSTAAVGLTWIALLVRQPVATMSAAIALLSYSFVYTPLKRVTTLSTLAGALPGAMPAVIGWTAVTNSFDLPAALLFAIIFLWQVPHFLAIAWIYRKEYSRAGVRVLPVLDPGGNLTARCMASYCAALCAASLIPWALGWTGAIYFHGAAVLDIGFVVSVFEFVHSRSTEKARLVLRASLVYLPCLLTILLIDGLCGTSVAIR